MTLQSLTYVTTIAKYKSISQAAKKLYMSQSTLSAAVKDLETELGICIFSEPIAVWSLHLREKIF